jgi:hypothetical protein
LSGGLGGPGPTFQFSFNNGFAPPQGGNIRLYATWQGALASSSSITLPSRVATDEMPPGINVLRVDTMTLTGFAPGQPFSITEVFDFTQDRGTFPFAPQGDVGATIMTTPVGVSPGPRRARTASP